MKVEPVMGEPLRFWVESESSPGTRHLVDLLEGACGCASYVCNRRAYAATHGRQWRCKHIIAARESALNNYIETVREHVLAR